MNAYDIIRRPIQSEKSYEGIATKKYTFVVDIKANKRQIKDAVEEIYPGTTVLKVNTSITKGKLKRQGKHEGYTPNYKKAVIQLTADSKAIDAFEA